MKGHRVLCFKTIISWQFWQLLLRWNQELVMPNSSWPFSVKHFINHKNLATVTRGGRLSCQHINESLGIFSALIIKWLNNYFQTFLLECRGPQFCYFPRNKHWKAELFLLLRSIPYKTQLINALHRLDVSCISTIQPPLNPNIKTGIWNLTLSMRGY